jgi:hypothetical protein
MSRPCLYRRYHRIPLFLCEKPLGPGEDRPERQHGGDGRVDPCLPRVGRESDEGAKDRRDQRASAAPKTPDCKALSARQRVQRSHFIFKNRVHGQSSESAKIKGRRWDRDRGTALRNVDRSARLLR